MCDGAPHADVLEVRVGEVELHQKHRREIFVATGLDVELAGSFEALDVVQWHRAEATEEQFAGLECRGARGCVRNDAHHQLVEIRPALVPIGRVALEQDEVALLPFLEHERTGADGLAVVGVGSEVGTLVEMARQDLSFVAAERAHQVRRRFGQLQDGDIGGRRLDCRDLGERGSTARVQLLPYLHHRELYVGRGEILAVVPPHTLAQVEDDALAVGADLPALGQHRLRRHVEVVGQQAFEDLGGDDADGRSRVEGRHQHRGFRLDHHGQGSALDNVLRPGRKHRGGQTGK